MGTLKPGATYVYERVDDSVYAREHGTTERRLIGKNYRQEDWIETQLWQDIVAAGRTNPSLQKALDRAKLIYQTIKDNDE